MPIRRDPGKWLRKKAKKGARDFPVGTIAFYGPDNRRASKLAAGVIEREGGEAVLKRWIVETGDVRQRADILEEATAFFKANGVRSVAMVDGIIGCPHEEGVDYPEGEACPACPFWAGRDRWTGRMEDGSDARADATLCRSADGGR